MTQQSQLHTLRESEVAFRNQFNPDHPSYHAGDPTPVPVGGNRLPEGCNEETPSETQSSSLSTEGLPLDYHRIHVQRELIGKIKTAIAAVAKPIKALHSASTSNRANMITEQNEVRSIIAQLENLVTEYKEKQESDEADVVIQVVKQMVNMCSAIPSSAEDYGEFVLSSQRLNGLLFKEQGTLLQAMKKIKKEAQANVAASAAT